MIEKERIVVKPPIILVGDGQVEFFHSTHSLEADVEAVDAADFKAYDSTGRPIDLIGVYRESRFLGTITSVESVSTTARPVKDAPSHAEELRNALIEWWVCTGGANRKKANPEEADWNLDQLVSAIAVRDGVK